MRSRAGQPRVILPGANCAQSRNQIRPIRAPGQGVSTGPAAPTSPGYPIDTQSNFQSRDALCTSATSIAGVNCDPDGKLRGFVPPVQRNFTLLRPISTTRMRARSACRRADLAARAFGTRAAADFLAKRRTLTDGWSRNGCRPAYQTAGWPVVGRWLSRIFDSRPGTGLMSAPVVFVPLL